MSSSSDENIRRTWDIVMRELVDSGEVSEDVLSDSDSIMRWWRSLDPSRQEVITGIVREFSQGQEVKTTPVTSTKERKLQKNIGLRLLLGIAAIACGLFVQTVGAVFDKFLFIGITPQNSMGVLGLLFTLLGFGVMGYLVYRWAIK